MNEQIKHVEGLNYESNEITNYILFINSDYIRNIFHINLFFWVNLILCYFIHEFSL